MDTQNANHPLDEYIENLIAEKKFPDLEPEVKEQIKTDLFSRLNDTINAKAIAALNEDDRTGLEKLIDEQKELSDIQKYLESKIPNYTDFIARILVEFKNNYLGMV